MARKPSNIKKVIDQLAGEFVDAYCQKTGLVQRRRRLKMAAKKYMSYCLIEERRSEAAIRRWKKLWKYELDGFVAKARPPVPSVTAAIAAAYGEAAARMACQATALKVAEEKGGANRTAPLKQPKHGSGTKVQEKHRTSGARNAAGPTLSPTNIVAPKSSCRNRSRLTAAPSPYPAKAVPG